MDVHVDGTFRRGVLQQVKGCEGDLERQRSHLNKPAASVPVAVFFLFLVQSEHAGNRFAICRGFSAGKVLVGKGKLAKIAAVYLPGVGWRLQRGCRRRNGALVTTDAARRIRIITVVMRTP